MIPPDSLPVFSCLFPIVTFSYTSTHHRGKQMNMIVFVYSDFDHTMLCCIPLKLFFCQYFQSQIGSVTFHYCMLSVFALYCCTGKKIILVVVVNLDLFCVMCTKYALQK